MGFFDGNLMAGGIGFNMPGMGGAGIDPEFQRQALGMALLQMAGSMDPLDPISSGFGGLAGAMQSYQQQMMQAQQLERQRVQDEMMQQRFEWAKADAMRQQQEAARLEEARSAALQQRDERLSAFNTEANAGSMPGMYGGAIMEAAAKSDPWRRAEQTILESPRALADPLGAMDRVSSISLERDLHEADRLRTIRENRGQIDRFVESLGDSVPKEILSAMSEAESPDEAARFYNTYLAQLTMQRDEEHRRHGRALDLRTENLRIMSFTQDYAESRLVERTDIVQPNNPEVGFTAEEMSRLASEGYSLMPAANDEMVFAKTEKGLSVGGSFVPRDSKAYDAYYSGVSAVVGAVVRGKFSPEETIEKIDQLGDYGLTWNEQRGMIEELSRFDTRFRQFLDRYQAPPQDPDKPPVEQPRTEEDTFRLADLMSRAFTGRSVEDNISLAKAGIGGAVKEASDWTGDTGMRMLLGDVGLEEQALGGMAGGLRNVVGSALVAAGAAGSGQANRLLADAEDEIGTPLAEMSFETGEDVSRGARIVAEIVIGLGLGEGPARMALRSAEKAGAKSAVRGIHKAASELLEKRGVRSLRELGDARGAAGRMAGRYSSQVPRPQLGAGSPPGAAALERVTGGQALPARPGLSVVETGLTGPGGSFTRGSMTPGAILERVRPQIDDGARRVIQVLEKGSATDDLALMHSVPENVRYAIAEQLKERGALELYEQVVKAIAELSRGSQVPLF